ncbi:2-polyprenyl-3-methyl-6-methoxy-1,4-benzoquinone monooxygenase [Acinetobacter rathckeae]|uniref:2-polyprenyl-3-methyl-6-methoxy-1,4-benzoquinone monooxygenase n=1 Tax=Acinetobacter rathckeae TaxID=2605272 RepID=UPI0018A293A4|nr:2-polyprenyl-3-methyl-6-methoxy-1,4-benzoquinone monooxygenase [Acinetobacter rathckeae]MBF7687107.1 2-polyprenyl-3-methyl-6-methoxy-1,4-benzoquinone monooxygenase [Acinetobacter rathckeae]MBF7694541.1 2-polyprenyl-3-methyl-6-methoxy-1,4-benzoquinone monooxygenase [Acinetobacter rathckeae]
MRHYSTIDRCIQSLDQALRSLVPGATAAHRTNPAEDSESALSISEARHVAGLMRVNHSGEVCAQALYHGQALTAKLPNVRREMEHAAIEEQDHLAWCEDRLKELDSLPSLLNPIWYGLSFAMGAIAGAAGDKYSLGFVAETERQVSLHLVDHIEQLPEQDERSRKILVQMNEDELKHRDTALDAGGVDLPKSVQITMGAISKLMTKTSYYI